MTFLNFSQLSENVLLPKIKRKQFTGNQAKFFFDWKVFFIDWKMFSVDQLF
jgi:hypothetical protein